MMKIVTVTSGGLSNRLGKTLYILKARAGTEARNFGTYCMCNIRRVKMNESLERKTKI